MKVFLQNTLSILFAIVFSFASVGGYASDAAAGNIWYEFVGDSLNPYDYRINIAVYYDIDQFSYYTPNRSVCISSSCFSDITASLPFVGVFDNSLPVDSFQGGYTGAILTPFVTQCIDTSAAKNYASSEIHFFSAVVTLPGKCGDFRFSSSSGIRRSYDNLGAGLDLYLYTDLNNLNEPNSSVQFVNPADKAFCTGRKVIWSQGATDPDGDSLLFEFSHAKRGQWCTSPVPIYFKPGYSVQQPFLSNNGISLDPKNGLLQFEPVQQEIVAFNIKVSEYRLVNGVWSLVGVTERGLQMSIVAGCNQHYQYGPLLDTVLLPVQLTPKDSVLGYGIGGVFVSDSMANPVSSPPYLLKAPTVAYDCFDTLIRLNFPEGVLCSSIADDGTDFRVVRPDSQLAPITGVSFDCGVDGYVRHINIRLHRPIDKNGDYMLFVKTGNDGNTLLGRCGFETPNFAMGIVKVHNCPAPQFELMNVSVEEDKGVRLRWVADSTTYNVNYFNSWQIFRSDSATNGFYPIGNSVYDTARTFVDSSMVPAILDELNFEYQLKINQNYTEREPSEMLKTILLTSALPDSADPLLIHYEWTDYNGWPTPEYEFYMAKVAGAGRAPSWVRVQGPQVGFNQYFHRYPELSPNNEGTYVAKVVATNPDDSLKEYKSESNWVYTQLIYEPPVPDAWPQIVRIPNVFTPNGDGLNDVFTIESDFQKVAISIYNRWGELVYHSDTDVEFFSWDGTHHRTSQNVANGVYYYVATLSSQLNDGFNNFTRVEETKKGHITLIGQ